MLVLAAGCGGLGEREEDLYHESLEALEGRDWPRVAELSSAVLEAEPNHAPSYVLRGRASFELGRHEEAFRDCERVEKNEDLTDEERFQALLYGSRASIELAREKVGGHLARRGLADVEARRQARDFFLRANRGLSDALSIRGDSYDANLWRGYSLLGLENYRKALEVLKICESLQPQRWEHRFFSALCLEGLCKVNTQSLETYFAITDGGPRKELEPLYEHLTTLSGEVPPDVASKVLERVEAFAAAVPRHSARIDRFLVQARSRREESRKTARLESDLQAARSLVENGKFQEASLLLEKYLAEEGEHPQAKQVLKETKETWSVFLEARTDTRIASGKKDDLLAARKDYELAQKLTTKVERLVVLQQKINAVELALSRQDTSRKIQEAHELLKAEKYQEVLQSLASTAVEGLSDHDKDLHCYLRGVANSKLAQWTAAVKAFGAMSQRNFEGLDALHGLALVRSGQETAGISMLSNIPAESRSDEVNRVLGHHCSSRGEHRKAAGYLSAIKSPSREDLEAHLASRKALGIEHYRQGSHALAVEELQAARQILEGQLLQKAVDLYLYLGECYYRMDDLERAKKMFQDLTMTDLTEAERRQIRNLYLYRGQISLREKRPDLAYRDFCEFIQLGAQLPPELAQVQGQLVATYADFMPMDKVQYWNYASVSKDYNYSLFVKGQSKGEYVVERREAGNVTEEIWSRDGIFLSRKIGETIIKCPLNLNPTEETLPFVVYTSQGQECTSEVVAVGQTVDLPGGRKFTDCLKVRVRRTGSISGGKVHSTRNVYYFAPNVGEVKQEVYRDDAKVSEIILSDYALKVALLDG